MINQDNVQDGVIDAIKRIINRMGDAPNRQALRQATQPEITGNHVFDTALRGILNELRMHLPPEIPEDFDEETELDRFLEFMNTKH